MAKKIGCPVGQIKIKGRCIPVLQQEIRASWCRKSVVGEEYPFDVIWDSGRSGYSDFYKIKKGTPILQVNKTAYDKVAKTMDYFSGDIVKKGDQAGILNERGYAKGKSMDVFIVTDGKRQLAVDPQGYDYPRYKSPIKIDGKVIPF